MDMDVYPVGGNVYAIYQYLKREGFDANVKDVVAELSHDKLASVNGWGFQGIGYPHFLDASEPASVAAIEAETTLSNGLMPVLNTSLFLPLDYFGNKNGYYERIVNGAGATGDR